MGGVGTTDNGGMPRSMMDGENGGKASSKRGFAIGADGTAREEKEDESRRDIFAGFSGGAVSLQSRHANKVASDFLSHDDIDEMVESKEERLEKERAKQKKILEKLRRKDKKAKKAKKKKRGKKRSYSEDEESVDGKEDASPTSAGGSADNAAAGGSLLESLEATAVVQDDTNLEKRKRQRHAGGSNGDDDAKVDVDNNNGQEADDNGARAANEKRKRFDQIMEKGKVRTDRAFNKPTTAKSSSMNDEDADDDDDDDDAFLNAALAKARRLQRLKELNNNNTTSNTNHKNAEKAEDAVVRAVEKLKQESNESNGVNINHGGGGGGITFEFDEMQEFTRALRAREDQVKRGVGNGIAERRRGVKATAPGSTKEVASSKITVKDEMDAAAVAVDNDAEAAEGQVEDVDMQELAQEMEDDNGNDDATNNNDNDEGAAFGSTASSAPIGRGMSSFLSLLKQTGEIKKHATKEEMRGRAKDKRTYEDYEKLDLQKVVNINTGTTTTATHQHRNNNGNGAAVAHEKDLEFAQREIKLEYRDDHGRLLTRKEAYRNMCYQFHGHGSSKKNQERRLKQIEREREEAKVASRQQGGTLGALKATQKATGKAFIIHKT
mmetsp:Transcript_25812/g.42304  ORF Transcript_25812/g.42304 Transcript_25812/m.42304 type:complete len:608 (+) Transcript_25812:1-1824(+)